MSGMSEKPFQRGIRSFVRREGKMTTGQQTAIEKFWPDYGVDLGEQELDLADLFGREAQVILEIGFGNGLSLAEMAEASPKQNFFGIEVHRPGVGSLLVQVGQRGLENIRVSQEDAVQVFSHQIPEASLDRVQIFFPDPWHKKKHHKRRLIQDEFVAMLVKKLKPSGVIHVATDWENYAEHILTVLERSEGLQNTTENYAAKPDYRPSTKYEARGVRLGHGVWDIIFVRRS
jgi:tRNA (guanine-N7-)-methyltransferase